MDGFTAPSTWQIYKLKKSNLSGIPHRITEGFETSCATLPCVYSCFQLMVSAKIDLIIPYEINWVFNIYFLALAQIYECDNTWVLSAVVSSWNNWIMWTLNFWVTSWYKQSADFTVTLVLDLSQHVPGAIWTLFENVKRLCLLLVKWNQWLD